VEDFYCYFIIYPYLDLCGYFKYFLFFFCAALCGVVMYNYLKVKDVRASQVPENISDRIAKVNLLNSPWYHKTCFSIQGFLFLSCE
jgi:hypothetical protein